MATNNFVYKNTDLIFAIKDKNSETKIEEARQDFAGQEFLRTNEWEKDALVIAEKTKFVDGLFGIKIKILVRSGYYVDGNFDYDFVFIDNNGNEYETMNEKDIKDILFSWFSYYSDKKKDYVWDREYLKKMRIYNPNYYSKSVYKKLIKLLNKNEKIILKIFRKMSDYILHQLGTMSNGEGCYSQIKKSQVKI